MKTLKTTNGEKLNTWNDLITKVFKTDNIRAYLGYTVEVDVLLDDKEVMLYKHWSHGSKYFQLMDGVNEVARVSFDSNGLLLCE